DREDVLVAGTVSALKEAMTRTGRSAGQKMARFRVEDLHGFAPVVCFADAYAICRELLATDGAVVVVRGRVDRRGEETGIVAEEVLSAEHYLASFDGAAVVHLREEEVPRIPALLEEISVDRGRVLLLLDLEDESGAVTRIRASESFRVRPGEKLGAAVQRSLGPGRLRLVRA
ncbi:MAG TPA: OB-fold nucleic acid binding domain-containing protein, partial [Planctomycetota bacterium]|nr:OB-fold nucleic acid binding domain-containing protein [Planctomycetota bacterium]